MTDLDLSALVTNATGEPMPESDPETLHRGQVKMAYRLAADYADQLMHVHGVGWHYWDGVRWAEDQQGRAKRAVLAVLRKALLESFDLGEKNEAKALSRDVERAESSSGVDGVLRLAAALEPFAFTVADLDADPYLLNTPSGTVDLRTMATHTATPTDRITKITRGAFGAPASPTWQRFLAEVLPDEEVRGFLARVIGAALLGLVREEIFTFLTGLGANGKTKLYEAVVHALGDYAVVPEADLLLHRDGAHPTGLMDLMGKRLAVVSESDEGRKLAEATMKRLTGGDRITARRMHKDFVTFTPSHSVLMVTNHLPQVRGDDPSLWRRIRVVSFEVVIPEERRDTTLGETLALEADGILTWAIDGFIDYDKRGKLDEPAAVVKATDTYQQDSDAVGRFIEDACSTTERDTGLVQSTTGDLYAHWQPWAQNEGVAPLSQKAFGAALDRKGFPASPAVNNKRWRKRIMPRRAQEQWQQ